ncbi:MAG: extracellular solute-binding protein [Clostridia bacterium]|nr:extracellular solute-binding protein [Clostridia bacterium]
MKKLCLLLVLLMALPCLPAMAAEGDAVLGVSDEERISFSYCFSIGDTLYLASYAELYTYHIGDADLTQYVFDAPVLDGSAESYDIATLPFTMGDQLYALNLITEYGETARFTGANIAKLTLQSDGVAAMADPVDVDWDNLVEEYEGNTYPIRPDSIMGVDGKAIVRYYDLNGVFRMASVDMSSGKMSPIDEVEDAFSITAYGNDALLIEQYSYESETQTARLLVYRPADESVEVLGDIQVEEYSPLQGLAYDPESDTVYCIKGGEVCSVDVQSGTVGEGVTDMPVESGGNIAGCILRGGFYAFCSEGAVVRSLDVSQRPQTRLKINDTSWNDNLNTAFYRFANAHGDVSVVLSREYSEIEHLLENMMNQDSSVDIYVLSTSTGVYDALYKRGYLMELDESSKVAQLAKSVYPALLDSLSFQGHVVAVPLTMSAWTLGINEKALGAIGLKLEDVPDNWPGFLDFLSGLGGKLSEAKGVNLFYSGYTVSEARNDLFAAILEDYQHYVSLVHPDMGYDTDLLRGLLEKLEQIDFADLGCTPDDEVDDNMLYYGDYNEDSILLQTGTGCSIGNFYSGFTPVLMRMEADAPALLALDTMVAVVNPYTKNREAALAFMDELVDDLPSATLYTLDPSLNEPVRGDMNQEALNDAKNELADLMKIYESASQEEKQSLEQEVTSKKREVEDYEANLWDVSPAEIEWYRAHAENVFIAGYNWLYEDEAGEAMEMIDQYREGMLSAGDLLRGIDKKVQMMLLEGN